MQALLFDQIYKRPAESAVLFNKRVIPEATTASDTIQKLASEMVLKGSDPSQVWRLIFKQRPDLYALYRIENYPVVAG